MAVKSLGGDVVRTLPQQADSEKQEICFIEETMRLPTVGIKRFPSHRFADRGIHANGKLEMVRPVLDGAISAAREVLQQIAKLHPFTHAGRRKKLDAASYVGDKFS